MLPVKPAWTFPHGCSGGEIHFLLSGSSPGGPLPAGKFPRHSTSFGRPYDEGQMAILRVPTLSVVAAALILVSCSEPLVPPEPMPPKVPSIATPDPKFTPLSVVQRPLPIPTATAREATSAEDTWLYLTAFQNYLVSTINRRR